MAISKITLNGVTQMDVTQKTVTAGTMLNNVTALKNDGTDIAGNIASQAAQTIYPSSTDQTISSGSYLTGEQTIKAVKITALEDALVYSSPVSRTHLGVTFDFNADKSCYVHGTSTAAGANAQYYINQSAMPSYIQLGVEYKVEYSSANVYFQIFDYHDGNLTKLLETKTNTTFTFPTTMTGAIIRLTIFNGVTADETVHPRLYLPRTTGLSGADILEGIILEIGDADDSDRILSVTGTATRV